jgi:HEAT repeat protein
MASRQEGGSARPPTGMKMISSEDGQALLEDLNSGDDLRAEKAARDLEAWLSSHTSTDKENLRKSLKAMLGSHEVEKRWWATRALAEIVEPQVTSLLVEALSDLDVTVGYCAALALRGQAPPQAVPALIAKLSGKDRMLAHLAADALISIGAAAVPNLLETLKSSHSQAARLEAVRALARIGDPRSIPALFETLDKESALIEYWANEGLERMCVGMVFYKPGG